MTYHWLVDLFPSSPYCTLISIWTQGYFIFWIIIQYFILFGCSKHFQFGPLGVSQLIPIFLWHFLITGLILLLFLCFMGALLLFCFVFEHFLTFWQCKTLQAHLVAYSCPVLELPVSQISPGSLYERMVLETKTRAKSVLVTTGVLLLMGSLSCQSKETHECTNAVYTYIYKYFSIYPPLISIRI